MRVDDALRGPRLDWLGGAKTDAAGAFRWDSLAAGHYVLHHYRKPEENASGRRASLRLFQKLSLRAGERRRMTSGDDLGSTVLSGRLLDVEGNPAEGFEVGVQPLFPWKYDELTTEVEVQKGGTFLLDVLVPGRYAVGVARNFQRAVLQTIDLREDTELVLRLGEEVDLSR